MSEKIEFLCDIVMLNIAKSMHVIDSIRLQGDSWDKTKSSKIELAVADAFAVSHFSIEPSGEVTAFTGTKYEIIEKNTVEHIVKTVLTELAFTGQYLTDTIPRTYNSIYRSLASKSLNPKRSLISFNNGILDTETFIFHDFNEKLHSIISLPIDYDPDAVCPKFDNFIEDVLPEREARMALQEFFGYIFVDRRKLKIEKICYLLGGGSNGKGVLYDLIIKILGPDNVSSYTLTDLVDNSPSCDYKMANLNGKLVNFCPDMGKKDASGGKYKGIVSGDPQIARHPKGRPFTAHLIPPMIANVNIMPMTSDQTNGHHRRTMIIPFNKTYVDKSEDKLLPGESAMDKELGVKLESELSGIFNWILVGTKRIVRNKGHFTESPSLQEAINKVRIESSNVLLFLQCKEYHISGDDEIVISLKELFGEYKSFCQDDNYQPMGKNKFSQMLEKEGFEKRRFADGLYFVMKRMRDYGLSQPANIGKAEVLNVGGIHVETVGGLPF